MNEEWTTISYTKLWFVHLCCSYVFLNRYPNLYPLWNKMYEVRHDHCGHLVTFDPQIQSGCGSLDNPIVAKVWWEYETRRFERTGVLIPCLRMASHNNIELMREVMIVYSTRCNAVVASNPFLGYWDQCLSHQDFLLLNKIHQRE